MVIDLGPISNLATLPIRGPRLGTKLLILMSLALVAIPWFSYLYLSEMEDFLVDSQANAQLLTAEGISTLLNGRTDLFYELPLSPDGYEQLYAHPLSSPIRIDGRDNDWEEVLEYHIGFGNLDDSNDVVTSNQFQLSLGEHNDQLYALITVTDEALVFRDRNILRLDLSDHLRLTFTGQDESIKKVVLTMTEPGITTAYLIDNDWRYAIQGEPENRIPGFMTKIARGYAIEFRIPLELLGSTQQFGLAVVDVDNSETRLIESITGTLPSAGEEAYGLVLLKSPEVLRIIEGLGYSGANIQVIDAQRRIRAEVGSYEANSTELMSLGEESVRPWVFLVNRLMEPFYKIIETNLRPSPMTDDEVINASLLGQASYRRRYSPEDGEVIVAAHPIISQNTVIGTVLLKQNTKRILELRRDALQRSVNFSILSLLIFVGLIFVFSVRLTGRIRKLESEATSAIDVYGRLKTNELAAETKSGDEIGDLARSISGMLARLHQHNQFLENMPRTLRHEINNPLNTLSTSLQNLEVEESETARQKYLDAAKRGVTRIGMIVQNLADAASLEDALAAEETEVVDLYGLVQNYLANCRTTRPDRTFEYFGKNHEIEVNVSDHRIEQLLDKLIDNAIDFSKSDSTITVSIKDLNQNLNLSVKNQGPKISEDVIGNVFDSMVSIRDSNPDNRLHFGMGLYVVRTIAERHGGSVKAINLPNNSGVSIDVILPVYQKLNAQHSSLAAT